MLLIFVLLTTQNWINILVDHIRAMKSFYPIFYFVVVIVVGNFILLNLFLAILIGNFSESAEKFQDKKENNAYGSYFSQIKVQNFYN